MNMQVDLSNRSQDIHWPQGFEPTRADLFAHNEIQISASCATVWSHIVDAAKWPTWYPNCQHVELLGADTILRVGTRWRWSAFGLPLESRVREHQPPLRLGWYNYVPGEAPAFYQAWLLLPQCDGCRVVMDKVGLGVDATNLRKNNDGLVHRGHDLWLCALREISEGWKPAPDQGLKGPAQVGAT